MVMRIRTTKGQIESIRERLSTDGFDGFLNGFMEEQSGLVGAHIIRRMRRENIVRRRTGTLERAIVGSAERVGRLPGMRVGVLKGPALKYAGVQEYGTKGKNPTSPYDTIKPRKAKALAIPAEGGKALTAAGVDRFGGPRGYPGELKAVPFTDSGIAVGALYDMKAHDRLEERHGEVDLGDLQPVYLLLKKVDIEPKWYLRDGFMERLPLVSRALSRGLKAHIEGEGKARG